VTWEGNCKGNLIVWALPAPHRTVVSGCPCCTQHTQPLLRTYQDVPAPLFLPPPTAPQGTQACRVPLFNPTSSPALQGTQATGCPNLPHCPLSTHSYPPRTQLSRCPFSTPHTQHPSWPPTLDFPLTTQCYLQLIRREQPSLNPMACQGTVRGFLNECGPSHISYFLPALPSVPQALPVAPHALPLHPCSSSHLRRTLLSPRPMFPVLPGLASSPLGSLQVPASVSSVGCSPSSGSCSDHRVQLPFSTTQQETLNQGGVSKTAA